MEEKNLRKELEARVIERAFKDENFRMELLRDPKGNLEKELGIKIPESVIVKIIEEKEGEVCLFLPLVPKQEGELTEAELETVAGGWTCEYTDCGNC
jgi:hypothetical protein